MLCQGHLAVKKAFQEWEVGRALDFPNSPPSIAAILIAEFFGRVPNDGKAVAHRCSRSNFPCFSGANHHRKELDSQFDPICLASSALTREKPFRKQQQELASPYQPSC